jgi:hypothetical protein
MARKTTNTNWTEDHLKVIADLYKRGLTFPQIAVRLQSIFGEPFNGETVRYAVRKNPWLRNLTEVHDQTRSGIGDITKTRNVKRERLFITYATPVEWVYNEKGKPVRPTKQTAHSGFLKAIETFLGHHKNSKLYIIPGRGHLKTLQTQSHMYDNKIMEYRSRFVTELEINGKLKIFDAKLNPQQINPLTGLHHIQDGVPGYLFRGEDDSGDIGRYIKNKRPGLIIGHPKQLQEFQPTGKSTLPRPIISTGSCCMPDYQKDQRMGKLAHSMHTLGGVVIDIIGDYYFPRVVQANLETGEFVDLGVRYFANGKVKQERALVMKPGDRHCGETDPVAMGALYEQAELLKPKEVIWEDYISFGSVNPHIRTRPTVRAMQPDYFHTLKNEMAMVRAELIKDVKNFPKNTRHVANYCNHHEWLDRYVESGQYKKEFQNNELGAIFDVAKQRGFNLAQLFADCNKDDLLEAMVNGFDSKMEWLNGEESYQVEGVEQGEHGHVGISGARGSKMSHYMAYGKANVGHSHRASIYNGIYTSGANTTYKQEYDKRQPIVKTHTNIVQYKGGHRQLITEFSGRWHGGGV